MGNRAYLYLGTEENVRHGGGSLFAEANSLFPTLWRVLLAGGGPGAANTDQRVFGDAGTPGLIAKAAPAFARIDAIAAFVRRHPRAARLPWLPMHFDALTACLRERCTTLGATDGTGLHFSADLDELSWLTEEPAHFIDEARADCDALWDALQTAMRADDHAAFDALLELDAYGDGYAGPDAWWWQFGFGGIAHPYFDTDTPREVAFDAFEAVDPFLHEGCEAFRQDGRWGLRRRAEADTGAPAEVLMPAEWDAIESAGNDAPDLLWVRRDRHWGLLRVEHDRAVLLRAPDLDAAWDFRTFDGDRLLAPAAWRGHWGLLGTDGVWHTAPERYVPAIEEMTGFHATVSPALGGGRYGFVDADGWRVPPQFEDAEWDPLTDAWRVVRDGRHGLLHADTQPWIAPAWDALQVLPQGAGVLVQRTGRWGLLDRDGHERIAPRYRTLEPLAQEGQPLRLLARERALGLIDLDGRVQVPFEYDSIEPFPAVRVRSSDDGCPHLLRIGRGRGRKRRYGAWDLRRGAEVVACTHEALCAFVAGRSADGADIVFLAQRPAPVADGRMRLLGVLDADGRERHPIDFVEIEGQRARNDAALPAIADALAARWREDAPAVAVDAAGQRWRLHRDGRREHAANALEAAALAGDRRAAYQRACLALDAGDAAAAREWCARAAGFAPRTAGLLGRLRGRVDWTPREVADDGLPEAMHRLARLLLDGEGGDPEPAAGRAWLELLLQRARNHRDAHVELADLYDEGLGGPENLPGALALYRRAALMNDAYAHYRLGWACEHGRGTPRDPEAALVHYRDAARRGETAGAHRAALVLLELAQHAAPETASPLRREAYEWLRPLADDTGYAWRADVLRRLGELHLGDDPHLRDVHAAERRLREAAELDDAAAIDLLIALHEDATGDRHDPAQAARWRERRRALAD